jgi:hypothetical protein
VDPLEDAVEVEGVSALSPDYRTVVARHLAIWAAPVERVAADAARVVVAIPGPGGDQPHLLNLYSHAACSVQ